MESLSAAMLKRSAFQDELVNVLNLLPSDQVDEEIVAVQGYLKKRLKQLEKMTK